MKLGRWEVKAGDSQKQSAEVQEESSAEELLRAFDNALLLEQEDRIRKELSAKGCTDQSPTVKILIRHLAATQLARILDRLDSAVFGSQLALLNLLNSTRQSGAPRE